MYDAVFPSNAPGIAVLCTLDSHAVVRGCACGHCEELVPAAASGHHACRGSRRTRCAHARFPQPGIS